jgi:hypothetical protein
MRNVNELEGYMYGRFHFVQCESDVRTYVNDAHKGDRQRAC